MSIAVNSYPATPYRQTPIAWPVKIFDPPQQKPASVMLQFNWLVYFAVMNSAPNIAVDVDINSGGTSQGPVLDKIVTIKIDNSNSLVPILVWFQDSGDVVSCAPQTIVTLPCTTNGNTCKVIAQGLSAGNVPMTNIVFYNYFIPPSIDPVLQLTYPQLIGSPVIQRNANQILTPGYGSPALGDQFVSAALVLTGSGAVIVNLWGTPLASGFIYLKSVFVAVANVNTGSSAQTEKCFLESTGAAGTLIELTFTASPTALVYAILLNMSGMDLKLDATQTWQLHVPGGQATANGTIYWYLNYAINPNK